MDVPYRVHSFDMSAYLLRVDPANELLRPAWDRSPYTVIAVLPSDLIPCRRASTTNGPRTETLIKKPQVIAHLRLVSGRN